MYPPLYPGPYLHLVGSVLLRESSQYNVHHAKIMTPEIQTLIPTLRRFRNVRVIVDMLGDVHEGEYVLRCLKFALRSSNEFQRPPEAVSAWFVCTVCTQRNDWR